jgi:hypothetical protein
LPFRTCPVTLWHRHFRLAEQCYAFDESNGRPEAYPTWLAASPRYWNDELEEAAIVLAEDRATGASDEPAIELPAGVDVIEPEALELTLSDWW